MQLLGQALDEGTATGADPLYAHTKPAGRPVCPVSDTHLMYKDLAKLKLAIMPVPAVTPSSVRTCTSRPLS